MRDKQRPPSESESAQTEHSFQDAVRKVLNAPQTPEQIAKKAVRKARAKARKRQQAQQQSEQ